MCPERFRPSRRSSSTSSCSPSSEIRTKSLAAAALTFAAVSFAAPGAQAIERQHHLGLAPALGVLSIEGKSTASVGVGGALHYAYGLSDQWNLTVEASSVVVAANQKQDFPYSPRNRPSTVDHGAVGIAYVIDILRWVPYVGVQGGVFRLAGGDALANTLILPGLSIGAGLDYQISRQLAVGIAGRQHFMISKMDTYPSYTTALLRFEYMWGY